MNSKRNILGVIGISVLSVIASACSFLGIPPVLETDPGPADPPIQNCHHQQLPGRGGDWLPEDGSHSYDNESDCEHDLNPRD